MLLSNLAKSSHLSRLIALKRAVTPVSTSPYALDQLLDIFVRGASNTLNKTANYDYLAYLLADLSKHASGREHLLSKREHDGIVPLSKLVVFTEHKSHIRRRGVASTIKNVAFEIERHDLLLADETELVNGIPGVNILPYILLPLAGSEEFPDDESAAMLPDLQLLPPDKARETDNEILITHLETMLLLTTTKKGRQKLRDVQVYALVRETHAHVEDEGVRDACDRLVQILARDEEEDEEPAGVEEIDEDDRIEEIF